MKTFLSSAFLLSGIFLISACSPKQMGNPLAGPPEVFTTDVVQKDVPVVKTWVGSLDGLQNASIRARVQGYLIKQDYKEGGFVKTGDVMFEIDPRPFQAALEQAKADLLKAQADQLNAELTEQRQVDLYNKKVISQADRDTAVQNSAASKASTEAAKAALDQAQLNLDFTKVQAPVDGIAGIMNPGIGDLVGPSDSQPLTTVSTVDPIKAYFQLSEQEYIRIADKISAFVEPELEGKGGGSPVELQLILSDGSIFPQKGKFSVVNRQVDPKTGTIQVDCLFPNPKGILRPGQFALIQATVRKNVGALLVPQRAVIETQGTYQVVVVQPDNKAEFRPVTVGERYGTDWVISEGLKAGEKVVVEGLQKLKDGLSVNAKPWTGAQPAATSPAGTK